MASEIVGKMGFELAFVEEGRDSGLLPLNSLLMDLEEFTVPVAPLVTFAVMLYAVPFLGCAGSDPRVTVEAAHVVCDAVVAGRLDAPESTGVTRTSYAVPPVRPVIVAVVSDALAVCAQVVQEEAEVSLYSTVKSVMPVVSFGSVHVATSRSLLPAAAVPDFATARAPTPFAPVDTLVKLLPCRPYVRAR